MGASALQGFGMTLAQRVLLSKGTQYDSTAKKAVQPAASPQAGHSAYGRFPPGSCQFLYRHAAASRLTAFSARPRGVDGPAGGGASKPDHLRQAGLLSLHHSLHGAQGVSSHHGRCAGVGNDAGRCQQRIQPAGATLRSLHLHHAGLDDHWWRQACAALAISAWPAAAQDARIDLRCRCRRTAAGDVAASRS